MEKTSFEFLSQDIRKVIAELGFASETPVQTEAIPAILEGQNVLVISPTGSGKTEAALLPIFEKIKSETKSFGIKTIYITPLRALNRDMLKRIEQWARQLNLTVEVRHGDTTQTDRRKQAINPPDILITTPETLQVLLVGSRLRTTLKSLKHIVVDEIHQLASDRRGSQLSFGLERLEKVLGTKVQRIGLSATVENPDEIARFLCGNSSSCKIVDTSNIKKLAEYDVEMPSPTREDELQSRELFVTPQTVARIQRIIDLVEGHDRTLIFVNSRSVAEELGSRLGMLGLKVGVHHGSLPREERERVEKLFKEGAIRAMVSTATLELGIDIGSVDLVIQYMSPRQVNSFIQRVGRSGHSLSRKSEGIILAVSPEDALESISISDDALARRLEPTLIHESPLDVLAHQVAGLLMEYGGISMDEVLKIAHKSFSFRSLKENDLHSVVTFMEKLGYLSLDDRKLLRRRKLREYYLANLSMIRDERRYSVIDITTQSKVGILGEEFMVLHAKVGIHFIVKGKVWQIESIQEDLVYVTPVQDPSAAIPGWDGEMIPIPESVARRVGGERRKISEVLSAHSQDESEADRALNWPAEKSARLSIIDESKAQLQTSKVPTDKRILIERFKNFLILHTSAGDRVNNTLGELFEEVLVRLGGLARHWWSDGYRILIELTTDEYETGELVEKLFHYDDTLSGYINSIMRKHFPFGYEMKFIAERFGALKRGRLMSGEEMKELGVKFRFTPIYDETLREAFARKVDIPRTVEILKECKEGEIQIAVSVTDRPSPLAAYILSRYAEAEDLAEPTLNSSQSMREYTAREVTSLLCFDCGNLTEFVRVGDLEEFPECEKCGSRLLAVLFYGARFATNALLKKKAKQPISKEENDVLSKTRRSADLVLAYGKKGVIAQSVYGVGPQMASRVLSRMHESDEEFYEDLLEAKLKFIETKKYWN